jgi:transposase
VWEEGDKETERVCIAVLADRGLARQKDLARAFGVNRTTVYRLVRAWREHGVAGLRPKKRGPKGPRVAKGRCRRQIIALGRAGYSVRAIAERLGLANETVYRVFRAEGLGSFAPQPQLFEPEEAAPEAEEADAAPVPAKAEGGDEPRALGQLLGPTPPVGPGEGAPARDLERVLACTGLVEEAEPVFVSGEAVPQAGVLMALALVGKTGLFEVAQRLYGRLRPAFYGLKNFLRVLCLMAFLRIKRVEGLASCEPEPLGRLVGLDRVPEVKTVRRKLNEVAAHGKAADFVAAMGEAWAQQAQDALGFLLVDGHVRVYSGTRKIPKVYSTRVRRATRGVSDYWVNDACGMPLFVVTAPANPHLTEVLPSVLGQARDTVGDRELTALFDRGGWSPKLFRQLRDARYHLMTYRVGKFRAYPRARFHTHAGEVAGKQVSYKLYDTHIRLRGFGLIRCVAVLRRDGRQTHILTTREDLSALEVAYWMFNRWRQENYLKYMREHFALDALVSYRTQPDDDERTVPNPKRKALDKKLAKVRAEIRALEAALGRLECPPEASARARRSPSREEIVADLQTQRRREARLKARRKKLPQRLTLKEVVGEGRAVLLEDERKRFTDEIKLTAYRVETELLGLIGPHYARTEDEGRALVREILQTAGDLHVAGRTVTVRLRPLSAPRHTAALAAACAELNEQHLCFPGTDIRLTFALKPSE